ncbi:MAG: ATP-grasp domain-containing protein, partial [Anaerolineae bacterium]|nr:ATP-grasp domain-containing protein [Anaerolineae bacterium]
KRQQVQRVPIHSDVELALAPFAPTEWLVFNLGEGIQGRLFEEARIAWALEAMGYCITGSSGDALARSIHKARAKQLFARAGIPTPRWRIYRSVAEVTDGLEFPLIVKPMAEDGSLGIDPEAVVHDLAALRARVAHTIACYRQAALVEEFIIGREFNVSLWGPAPDLLPLAEIDFHDFPDPYEQIVSFAAKWDPASFAYHHTPVICPAAVDDRLAERIRRVALAAWQTIGCRGYARVDIRVDRAGQPYVIEVNCNPDLSPEAGFFQAVRRLGYSYEAMVNRIVAMAVDGEEDGEHRPEQREDQ